MKHGVIAFGAALMLAACGPVDEGPRLTAAEADISEGFLGDPELGDGYAALEKNFPYIWQSYVAEAAKGIAANGPPDPALNLLETKLAPATPGLIVASDAELQAFLQARIALLQTLQAQDVSLCADYVRFRRLPPVATAPEPIRAAILRQRTAYFRALGSAIDDTTERPDLTKAEEQQMTDITAEQSRKAGLPERLFPHSPPSDHCNFELVVYRSMAAASPTLGGRLFANDVMGDWEDKARFPPGI